MTVKALQVGDPVTLVISNVPGAHYVVHVQLHSVRRTVMNYVNGTVENLVPENEGIFWLRGHLGRNSDAVKAAVVAQCLTTRT
jgi:hypothetical protein